MKWLLLGGILLFLAVVAVAYIMEVDGRRRTWRVVQVSGIVLIFGTLAAWVVTDSDMLWLAAFEVISFILPFAVLAALALLAWRKMFGRPAKKNG